MMHHKIYNFDPLKPHFYIVKLFFLFLLNNIDCGYLLKLRRQGSSNVYHNLCFEQEYEKYQCFLSEHFHFFEVKFSIY